MEDFLLSCIIQLMIVINHYLIGSMNGLTWILKVNCWIKHYVKDFIIFYLVCSYLQVSESTLISMLGDFFFTNKFQFTNIWLIIYIYALLVALKSMLNLVWKPFLEGEGVSEGVMPSFLGSLQGSFVTPSWQLLGPVLWCEFQKLMATSKGGILRVLL